MTNTEANARINADFDALVATRKADANTGAQLATVALIVSLLAILAAVALMAL